MNKIVANKIFLRHRLENIKSLEKITIGFCNDVYLVNDKFILKICRDKTNEINFKKENYFYHLWQHKLPVPRVLVFDDAKRILNRSYMIYQKINGENLFARWHLLSDSKRKNIIRQLCGILQKINRTASHGFSKKFKLDSSVNWQNKIAGKILKSLRLIENKKILSKKIVERARCFVEENKSVLTAQKIALVYWDAHFDNILVKNDKIVGILDFERVDFASIDFALDIARRMVLYPKKYMAKKWEKFARKKDYARLLVWMEEFYPELFAFPELTKRLALYSLEHDLATLIDYPSSRETKAMINKIIEGK